MPTGGVLSRRSALRGASAILSGVAALSPGRRTNAQEKVTKGDAKYQANPHGQQRCEICLQFEPPHSCKLVEGQISPTGWCQFFAARENAR